MNSVSLERMKRYLLPIVLLLCSQLAQAGVKVPAIRGAAFNVQRLQVENDSDELKSAAIINVVVTRSHGVKKISGGALSQVSAIHYKLMPVLIEANYPDAFHVKNYLFHIYPSLHYW